MHWEDAQRMAASALSAVLTNHHVEHAFIGGFAVQIIGSLRRTEDIDVQIGLTDGTSREQVVQHLLAADSRFSVRDTKLSFTPAEAPEYSVPIETLPVGSLGLPPALDIIRLGDAQYPILRPSVLILTEIKRCVHFIGSTRPKSMHKLESDLDDIENILLYLKKHGEKINFASYSSPTPDRLYAAVGKLLQHYRSEGLDDMVDTLLWALEESDRAKVDPA
ncbi:hypothetical protein A9Z42_0072990 [Trichoderma parareesei]|uniref:Nucleotidyl transferase AbiEii/AbiGii toxin family protein n=1 Tax=Trichoderma parareesei TaxID=858221 RepID=A0A2H2ZTV3_TRIPA|nr:hypothetical protein A9Z42_0072990 [Trichoderma parareesei]